MSNDCVNNEGSTIPARPSSGRKSSDLEALEIIRRLKRDAGPRPRDPFSDLEAMEILRRLKRAEPVFDRRDRWRRNSSSTGESTS